MAWRVEVFVDEKGRAPVEEFISELSVEQKAKILALVSLLKQVGPSLPFPYSSQVKGKLRELRTQYGKDKVRILYFADFQRTFILLHGLMKRTARLPEEDIQLAEARMQLHSRRLGRS